MRAWRTGLPHPYPTRIDPVTNRVIHDVSSTASMLLPHVSSTASLLLPHVSSTASFPCGCHSCVRHSLMVRPEGWHVSAPAAAHACACHTQPLAA